MLDKTLLLRRTSVWHCLSFIIRWSKNFSLNNCSCLQVTIPHIPCFLILLEFTLILCFHFFGWNGPLNDQKDPFLNLWKKLWNYIPELFCNGLHDMNTCTSIKTNQTCVAAVSMWILSKAITENTHVFPVPDLACTIKSEKQITIKLC